MSSTFQSVKTLVSENSAQDFLNASKILIRFASNVLEQPNEEKYRKIRLTNPTVQSKLLNVSGGIECLFEMGFEEDEEFLTLKVGTTLEALGQIKLDLEREKQKLEMPPDSSARCNPSNPPTVSAHSISTSEANFFSRLQGAMAKVLSYENPASQEKARGVIPLERLKATAQENFELNGNERRGRDKKPYDLRDFLMLALLGWFKGSFFKWVDSLPCSSCNGPTHNTGSLPPSQDDLRHGAGRVEAHTCNVCARVTRFPRYGSAEKLLETRRGRCGEWADCFTLCCRALDYEARYVLDWTDHVWTEVFSTSQDKWIHCDPCENVMDKPLLYESGWKKKLTYVIAFAKDDIRDVSWRYSDKHEELLSRRHLCREKWLVRTIQNLRMKTITDLSESRRRELEVRLVREMTGFLCGVKGGRSEVLPGRTTGSEEWRRVRGELGNGAEAEVSTSTTCTQVNKSFVFTPVEEERESELMHVCYSCSHDRYFRKSSKNEQIQSWLKCSHSSTNIRRKEEFDWKMAYLARKEGTDLAEISWKFDLTGTDLRISKMELKASSAVFEGASVSWRICAGDNCFIQSGASLQEFMTFDLHGSLVLAITAVLKGGKGENAWQHSQLFRQSMDDEDNFPFEVKLHLD